ncbi:hypothetical protein A3E66_05710 [Candidatus Daviesbacteria bacterium RIFCSPHIGHO2_12_FULL_37_16]|uniref:[acyl-carrier-protein] S-malonyltransferase n=3 Tax=Candidatus Daviesiibacteriota TaxID=1752718 RepID=A0A0G0I139_9BACT|nr:MAG: Malonyl CoA-acyl carrier protein transacylase [Candidatus Daviesbacteria bacterium GW2011_GWB1_36_5]KKQ16027.1 MAG: Malonyl CoA-acyl carrier protein transacylase [Candidatus Daviesbacteria bacterium GW2011_GWA1_36_8]OGE31482.1 MAG: hypothetical protein A3C99_02455 [Candidatus Daviesbacteria bacterium RIFCSPHIGHO2_02_FULL_37_9]OGE36362.1 MAG: hypothetical protein A3E66_05710 [Candidatus Daviesbacteria bacterium RIFCSPHIGHO2_12_FULL_37_16]
MIDTEKSFIVTFAGQAAKDYPNAQIPELAQHREAIENFEMLTSDSSIAKRIKAASPLSFGYFATLAANEVVTSKQAEELVIIRYEIVQENEAKREAAGLGRTAMASVLIRDRAKVEAMIDPNSEEFKFIAEGLGRIPEIYISNEYGNLFVLAGDRQFLEVLSSQSGSRVNILESINAGYHCPLMQEVSIKMEQAIQHIDFKDSRNPIITPTDAEISTDGRVLKDAVIKALWQPVNLEDIIKRINELKASIGDSDLLDCGPGTLIQRLLGKKLDVISLEAVMTEIRELRGSLADRKAALAVRLREILSPQAALA